MTVNLNIFHSTKFRWTKYFRSNYFTKSNALKILSNFLLYSVYRNIFAQFMSECIRTANRNIFAQILPENQLIANQNIQSQISKPKSQISENQKRIT